MYNLGNTHPVNVSDFVAILEGHLGKQAKRNYIPMPSTGDVMLTHADVSKVRRPAVGDRFRGGGFPNPGDRLG